MSKCYGCEHNWPLGRYGCHYEPIPDELLDEDGYAIRQQMNCTNWEERRKEFYDARQIEGRQSPLNIIGNAKENGIHIDEGAADPSGQQEDGK